MTTPRPYYPNRPEQDLQREVARADRMENQHQAELQTLPDLRTKWFPDRVSERSLFFQQEVARLTYESKHRRSAALPENILWAITGKGGPRNTGSQEEQYLLRSIESLRLQLIRADQADLSWIARREQEVEGMRVRLDADKRWLQQELQRHVDRATSQGQKDWLESLRPAYPRVLVATPSP